MVKKEDEPYYCSYPGKVCSALKNMSIKLQNCKEQNVRLINENKKVMKNKIKKVFDDIGEFGFEVDNIFRITPEKFEELKKKYLR